MGAGACLKLDREDRKEELTKKSDAPESIVMTAALTWCAGFCLRRKAGQSRGTCDAELRGQTCCRVVSIWRVCVRSRRFQEV